MSSFFSTMFHGYLKAVSAFSELSSKIPFPKGTEHELVDYQLGNGSFEAADEKATRMGNKYRGVGVVVGGLGIAIVLAAIAPFALSFSERAARLVGVIEVFLMLVAGASLLCASLFNWHSKWIDLRRCAEKLRYADLRQGIDLMTPFCRPSRGAALPELCNDSESARQAAQKKLESAQQAARKKLESALADVFGGGNCQIKYNNEKAAQYRKIESFSNVLGWGGFGVALTAAIMHLFWHNHALLFATGFLPALVGGIHGINHFLRIGDLAEDHARMAERLTQTKKSWQARASNGSNKWLLNLCKKALKGLEERDAQWEEEASRRPVTPGG